MHGYKCVFPLFYTRSPEHTPTHTPQSCTDSLTYSPFPFICTPHTETHAHTHTHTDRHTHAMQAYTQHQTLLLTDTHTHTHTDTHLLASHRGRWGGGSKHRDPTPSLKCSLGAHTHARPRAQTRGDAQTDKRSSAHMSTHPDEVEQRAQRQHAEAPARTPRWEERSEVCQKTHYLQSTFRLLQHVRAE